MCSCAQKHNSGRAGHAQTVFMNDATSKFTIAMYGGFTVNDVDPNIWFYTISKLALHIFKKIIFLWDLFNKLYFRVDSSLIMA